MSDLMRPRKLSTTRWTLVLAASGDEAADAHAAWASLCQQYWYPVYAFVKRHGRSEDDARDLTQAFFARTFEKHSFAHARRERGRFRTFLLTSVANFLANQHEREHARKRGGGLPHVALDATPPDAAAIDLPDTLDPNQVYERCWASATLESAMTRLERTHAAPAEHKRFERLKPLLTDTDAQPYAAIARDLDVSEGAIRVAVHRLRRQYGQCLRDTIAETVADATQVDDELRYLLEVVSRR